MSFSKDIHTLGLGKRLSCDREKRCTKINIDSMYVYIIYLKKA